MKNRWVELGSIAGFLAVALGAIGAHVLASYLTEKNREIYHTATLYLIFHSLALIVWGLWCDKKTPQGWVKLTGVFFAVGILLFSGSLYAISLTDIKILGVITPFGGLSFLIGWIGFFKSARG